MKYLFFFLCLSISATLSAQKDSAFVVFEPVGRYTFINEMTPLRYDKIGCTKRTEQGYYALVTDTKGRLLHERLLDTVAGYAIEDCSYILDDSTRYVYLGGATRAGKSYYLTFALDTGLQHITLIDALPLEDHTTLFFNVLKYNPYNKLWESFGIVQNPITGKIVENCYISMDNNYYFKHFEMLTGKFYKNHILEFIRVEAVQRYLVSSFTGALLLVNDEFQVVNEDVIRYSYVFNNSTGHTFDKIMSCEAGADGMPICYNRSFEPEAPFGLSFSKFQVEADTVLLAAHIPINAPPLDLTTATQMRRDRNGDYVISGIDVLSFNQASNKVRVVKFSPDFRRLWEFTYSGQESFAIWDMDIDANNDIILAGEIWPSIGSISTGFLMKVHANGHLSSWQEVPLEAGDVLVLPNPSSGSFCVRTQQPVFQGLRLWDMAGRLVWAQDAAQNGSLCFDLPASVGTGVYALEVRTEGGQRVVRKLVVSR